MWAHRKTSGFTIVELLIVIVVIGILAAITIVSFNGVQDRARSVVIVNDIKQVAQLIEQYSAINGYYPITSTTTMQGGNTNSTTLSDSGCSVGTSTLAWVPDLTQALPQSTHNSGAGVNNLGGCYMYQSDGTSYLLSAWNMLKTPQNSLMYRRIGFREMTNLPFYYCNQVNIGGNNPTPYSTNRDYYKYSYTITNINYCNETPPTGA